MNTEKPILSYKLLQVLCEDLVQGYIAFGLMASLDERTVDLESTAVISLLVSGASLALHMAKVFTVLAGRYCCCGRLSDPTMPLDERLDRLVKHLNTGGWEL